MKTQRRLADASFCQRDREGLALLGLRRRVLSSEVSAILFALGNSGRFGRWDDAGRRESWGKDYLRTPGISMTVSKAMWSRPVVCRRIE